MTDKSAQGWLRAALERVAAGESVEKVLNDYGWRNPQNEYCRERVERLGCTWAEAAIAWHASE